MCMPAGGSLQVRLAAAERALLTCAGAYENELRGEADLGRLTLASGRREAGCALLEVLLPLPDHLFRGLTRFRQRDRSSIDSRLVLLHYLLRTLFS